MTAIGGRVDVAARRGVLGVSVLLPMLVVGLSSSGLAQESPCDRQILEHATGAHGYKLRGDRCEGIYGMPVGGPTLFVASLTEFFEDYDVTSVKPLIVEWSQPAPADVQLRAEGLKPKLYYRMDSRRPAGTQSFSWPSDVLVVRTIKSADIGVVGRMRHQVGPQPREVYVPLRIRQSQAPTSCSKYTLVLFPRVRLDEVHISLASLNEEGTPEHSYRENTPVDNGFFPAGRPIKVTIAELEAQGVHYLGISAKTHSGAPTAMELWFYHAGRSPACG